MSGHAFSVLAETGTRGAVAHSGVATQVWSDAGSDQATFDDRAGQPRTIAQPIAVRELSPAASLRKIQL